MANIKQLSDKLANMIAAGEVVDRPASVIKELVENSIDAKASIIKIEVNDFGLSLIRVTDNGTGMDYEDASLAFFRHATSKIKAEGDLNHIASLGFRGEALPSIASVSKVLLKTKEEGKDGIEICLEGSNKISEKVATMNKGTIITVSDLFYNTPARFKYIKSDNAEKNAILDIFNALALSHPGISMSLWMDQKLIKETYGNFDMANLLAQIYGKEIAKDFIIFNDSFQKINITGYLVNPKHTKSRKKDINIFINNRFIKNYILTNAVVEGYHSFLMNNRYPIALIYIEIDPSLVDVNVHPQKFEVKLVNEYLLSYQLTNIIKESLRKNTLEVSSVKMDNLKTIEITPLDLSFDNKPTSLIVEEYPKQTDVPSNINQSKIPFFEYIGTLGGTYLLFQNTEGLFLIDQHAAAERIRYEAILEGYQKEKTIVKRMLVPRALKIEEDILMTIKANKDKLFEFGFTFNDALEINGIPSFLTDYEIEDALDLILTSLAEKNHFDLIELRDELAKSIACKGAIKANKNISKLEVDSLISSLQMLDNPYTCPHGRPIIIKLTYKEIEKLFKRIV